MNNQVPENTDRKSIFGIGTVVVDDVVVLSEYPEEDTKANIAAHWRQIGGPVPVALSVAQFYGAETSFAGHWGTDSAGEQIHTELTTRGINLEPSRWESHWKTGFAHVWTSASRPTRTIAFSRGSFADNSPQQFDRQLSRLSHCSVLHLDGAFPELSLAAAQQAKHQGKTVVLDAGSKKPGMEKLLPYVDVLIASNLFCRSWFDRDDVRLEELAELGCQEIVRTLGDRGASCHSVGNTLHVPAVTVVAVDTNGAGDIFAGAFLFGLVNQWEPERRLRFANEVAGHSCAHQGNSTWPQPDQLSHLLE